MREESTKYGTLTKSIIRKRLDVMSVIYNITMKKIMTEMETKFREIRVLLNNL